MKQSTLKENQMVELRKNAHIERVTEAQVFFTREFKQHFYEEHLKGKTPVHIVSAAGIDPEVLGYSRIRSLKTVSYNQARQLEPLSEEQRSSMPPDERRARVTEERISRLDHELAYTKQSWSF